MFNGEYRHGIDDKGRLIMPAKFRDEFHGQAVISRAMDPCLNVYTKEGWEEFTGKLLTLSRLDPRVRKMQRILLSGALNCELDKQGRIVVPPNLRDVLGSEKDVCVVGVGPNLEIWNEKAWDEHISEISDDMESLTMDLAELGFTI